METLVSKRTMKQIIQNDAGYLVMPDLAFSEPDEVTRQPDGTLTCECFTFTILEQECEHIAAVRSWIGNYQLPTMTQADADYYLSRLGELDAMKNENTASADLQIQRVKHWLDFENGSLDRKRQYFVEALAGWMSDSLYKTKRLVNGTLRLRTQPLIIEVIDEAMVMQDKRFVRNVPAQEKLDKASLRAHITETGEEIEGTRIEISLPKFSYTTNPL